MVTPIPTFRSDAVTQVPSMGIVQQSGMRDLSRALGNKAKVWDQVSDISNKKANEFMARRMQEQGQEAVINGGLDPSTLKNPVTLADRIFRESALNTYAMQIENDVARHLNELSLKNHQNPSGFQAQADGYLKGMVSKLPMELKVPVGKDAASTINSKLFSIQQQVQRQALAENQAMENMTLARLEADIVNSPVEMREALMAKASAIIAGSAHTITEEGQRAKLTDFQKRVIERSVVTDVMNGVISPGEAVEQLKSSGVSVDPGKQEQIYASSFVHHNYQQRLINQREAEAQAVISGIERELNYSILAAEDSGQSLNFAHQEHLIKEAEAAALRAGASPDQIFKMATTFRKNVSGRVIDNDDVVLAIQTATDNALPNTPDMIQQALGNGQISAKKARELQNDYVTAQSSIISDPETKRFLDWYRINYAPLAGMTIDPHMNADQAANIRAADSAMKDIKNSILSLSMGDEKTAPKSKGEVLRFLESDIRANKKPVPAVERASATMGNPEQSKVQSITAQPDFILRGFSERGRSITITPDSRPELKEVLSGPWSADNYEARIKLMIESNREAKKRGMPEPYSINEIGGIYDAFR